MPGLAGRHRKPTTLRIVDGNRGRRPPPKAEPKPKLGKPPKPAHITADKFASAEWNRLVALMVARGNAVLTIAHGPMLEATVLAYSDFRQARSELASGTTYILITKLGGKMIRVKPQVFIAADAWRRYVAGLSHFGQSPATSGKVQMANPDDQAHNPETTYGL